MRRLFSGCKEALSRALVPSEEPVGAKEEDEEEGVDDAEGVEEEEEEEREPFADGVKQMEETPLILDVVTAEEAVALETGNGGLEEDEDDEVGDGVEA